MTKKLPVISLKINPKEGSLVSAIAIVESPAIASSFLAFSKNEPLKFQANAERMELIGAAMIPDLPMYRNTKGVGEYMAVFEAETIREIAQVFAERGFFNNMNIDHTDKNSGSYVFQSYIVDQGKGINAPTGLDVPDGTWIIGVKVKDAETWQSIKDGKITGFSVEGFFDLVETSLEVELAKQFEAAAAEYFAEPKGCLMFFPDIDRDLWSIGAKRIAPAATEIENEPHVTILCGFDHTPDVVEKLKAFLPQALNVAPLQIELGNISKFVQPDHDVLKVNVLDLNGSLFALNAVLSEMFDVVSEYGDYKPHLTIAYMPSDPTTTFSSDPFRSWDFGINHLNKGRIVYSSPEREQIDILSIK